MKATDDKSNANGTMKHSCNIMVTQNTFVSTANQGRERNHKITTVKWLILLLLLLLLGRLCVIYTILHSQWNRIWWLSSPVPASEFFSINQSKAKRRTRANKQEFLAPFSPISYGYGGLHLDDCYSCFKLQSINNVLQRNIICHATVFALVSTENGGIFMHSNKSTDQFSARLCCDFSHSVAVCVEDKKKF